MKLRKLMPVSVLGIAALALAGCGVFDSDDDDSPAPAVSMSGMDMPDDDAPDVDAGPSAQTLEDARAALAELGEDATDEDRAAAQKDVDDALRLEGNEDELIVALQAEIDAAAAVAAAAAAEMEMAERIARAEAIETAIGLSRVDPNLAADSQPMKPSMESGVTVITAMRDADGVVTVDVNGDEGDDYSGGETHADDSGWTYATLTKTNLDNESTDTVVIYTDIEAPTATMLTMELTTGSVTIDDDDERGRMVPASVQPEEDGELAYGAGDMFKGTYRGIQGTFVCTLTCTVSVNADGEVVVGAEEQFSFVPTNQAATYDEPDAAYTYFGWWLNKPDDRDEVHVVEVFSGGNTATHAVLVTEGIEGTATYMGPAAGKYVTKTSEAGVQTDASVGHFAATAHLTAKFGAADALGTIEGAVRNFELDDGTSPAWSVMLEEAALMEGEADFGGSTEVNFGGGPTATDDGVGMWQGSFYNDTDAATVDDVPGTVAGTFDAVKDNASVIGGFGATLQ